MAKNSRLRRADTAIGRAQVADRLNAVRRIVQWDPHTRERRAALLAECERLNLSETTLYDLAKLYDADGGGPEAVERKLRGDRGRARDTAQQAAWIALCSDPAHQGAPDSTLAALHQATYCATAGVEPVSMATLRRWRRAIDPRRAMTTAEAVRASGVKGRVVAKYPNHCWIADQRTADIFVREPIIDRITGEITGERTYRPILFHFVDVFSGLEMGGAYYREYTTATVLEGALLDAIYPDYEAGLPFGGIPEMIWWDKGRQHWSRWSRDTMRLLNVRLIGEKSAGGEPTHHGLIEATHQVIKNRFETLQPGYCAGEVRRDDRPLPLRLAADGETTIQYLTLDELNARYRVWLADHVQQPYTRHGQTGNASRLNRWRAGIKPERFSVPDRAELGLMFRPYEDVTVTREGHVYVAGRGFTHPMLGTYQRGRVRVRYLKSDLSYVVITDYQERGGRATATASEKILCVATPIPDAVVGDVVSSREVASLRKVARKFATESRTHAEVGKVLVERGLLAAEDGQALEQGVAALVEVVKPGRTVPHDVERIAADRAAKQPSNVVRLEPRPGHHELSPPDDRAEAAADLIALAGGESTPEPADTGSYGLWD
ncbi:MAG TPA: hypothetical protein DCZ72_15635 [Armatimonadetes bacterium]|nr:hypothetical protein [Armatimonadota bacterium]